MTISSEVSRWSFTGDDSTTVFAFTNKIFADADLAVYVDEVLQTLTTDYTVSGAGVETGGNVTFVSGAPALDTSVVIIRVLIDDQTADYPVAGAFPAVVTEDALDRRTILSQQHKEIISRAPLYAAGTTTSVAMETPIGSNLLKYNAAGTKIINTTIAELSSANQILLLSGNIPLVKDDIADMVADTTFVADQYILTREHTAGLGFEGTNVWLSRAVTGASAVSGSLEKSTGNTAIEFFALFPYGVNVKHFGGGINDGSTDEGTILTNFFNHAIANPGIPHLLFDQIYATTVILPTINVSNVKIIGVGTKIHDVGNVLTGTIIKYTGASSVGPLITITAISGASNPNVNSIAFDGIGIDCNTGLIDVGMEVKSIWESKLHLSVINAGVRGICFSTVNELGEATDCQRNDIRFFGRQIEVPGAVSFFVEDNASSSPAGNFSLNEVYVDIQHKDIQAIEIENSDNNDWRFLRTTKASGGSATDSVSLLGGATADRACRAERFHFVSTDLAFHIFGTSGSPSFAVASTGHNIYALDSDNSSPIPILEVGASIHVQQSSSNLSDDPWVNYTPTITSSSGTITTVSGDGFFAERGKIISIRMQVVITTNGTGAGSVLIPLPAGLPNIGTLGVVMVGVERAVTGRAVTGFVDGSSDTDLNVLFEDGSYPGADGAVINISGDYETL